MFHSQVKKVDNLLMLLYNRKNIIKIPNVISYFRIEFNVQSFQAKFHIFNDMSLNLQPNNQLSLQPLQINFKQ